MPLVRAGEVQLSYSDQGTGDPPLIFVHGYTSSRHKWDEVLQHLPVSRRALAFDLRGAGESDRPEAGYNIEQYATNLQLALQQLRLGPCTFVGHSLGAAVGILVCLRRPELVHRLVLVGPALANGGNADEGVFARRARLRKDASALLEAKRSRLERPRSEAVLLQEVADNQRWSDAAYRECWESIHALRIADQLPRIGVPTLAVLGDRDAALPLQLRDAMAIPGCGLHVFHGAGHELAADEPVALAALAAG